MFYVFKNVQRSRDDAVVNTNKKTEVDWRTHIPCKHFCSISAQAFIDMENFLKST